MAREDEYRLPDWAQLETDMPKANFEQFTNPDNPWLPKTDWSRDGIIANED